MTAFAALHDQLTAAGLHVGIASHGGSHAITVTDPGGDREILLRVDGGFDRAARILVHSMRLRELLAAERPLLDLRCHDRRCRGRWPEFLEPWPRVPGRL